MKISKTLFKEYTKCKVFYTLDEIYYKKKNASIDEEEAINILEKMFDDEGEDLVRVTDKQLELMQNYYKEVERVALKEASLKFNKEFVYQENTKDQMKISYTDNNGYELYTYLDGFSDTEEVIVVEVKATTNRKYLELGPKINKKLEPIFDVEDNIMTLKKDIHNSEKKYNFYKKLFDRYSDVGKYMYDIAVTYFIYNGFLINNHRMASKPTKFYLAVLNCKYQYDGVSDYDSNSEKVIHFIDVTSICEEYQPIIRKEYNDLVNNIINKNTTDKYSSACEKCVYSEICFPFLKEQYNIKTLLKPKEIKISGEKCKINNLINDKCYKYIYDIPFNLLENKKHIIQYNSIKDNKEYENIDLMNEQIKDNIKYPIYHLDFESFQSPLPRYKGETPYMQSVFQFSIHVQKEPFVCDRELDNYSFLPSDCLDHREELIKEMINIIDLSKGGTVLVFNKNFEVSRLKEMIKMFPNYEKELQLIIDHIYDLLDVFRKGDDGVNYYHPKLNGSYSIKKILPIFSNISYSDLEVKNGIEAQTAYLMFDLLPKEDVKKIREELLIYCKQDTYSMVEILDNIIKKVRCN